MKLRGNWPALPVYQPGRVNQTDWLDVNDELEGVKGMGRVAEFGVGDSIRYPYQRPYPFGRHPLPG